TYTMRVADPGRFMTEIVGTDGEFTADEISYQIRSIIIQEFSRVIAASGIPVLDMAANTADLGTIVAQAITPPLTRYGLSVPEFYIENISLPEAVEAALDKRTSMGIVGDLNRYMQYSAGEALARGDGGGAGAAMGAGMGAGMGMAMGARLGPWGQMPDATGAAVPPPPPVEKVWHIAEGGATKGPFG